MISGRAVLHFSVVLECKPEPSPFKYQPSAFQARSLGQGKLAAVFSADVWLTCPLPLFVGECGFQQRLSCLIFADVSPADHRGTGTRIFIRISVQP
jgi:hypothetical protein